VERIYEIKNRPKDQGLPLLIADVGQLTTLVERIPEMAWFFVRRFWPGGLTLVLSKKDSLPTHVASGPTIAARMPNHPVCLALIKGLGKPITGTSANVSGLAANTTYHFRARAAGDGGPPRCSRG
jgi:L-threonylcarbamoyladenylate synthase